MHINIHESDPHLSQLVERVTAGEEIVIDKAGEVIAKIVPYQTTNKKTRRLGGQWRGKVKIAPDFDELPDEIAEAFGVSKE